MEITPPNTSQLERRIAGTVSLSQVKLSPLEALQLVAGKTYHAKVLGTLADARTDGKPAAASPNQTQVSGTDQKTATQAASSDMANPKAGRQSSQWILLINDKAVLVETLAKLSAGQMLTVATSATGKGGEPTLQISGSAPSIPTGVAQTDAAANIDRLIKAISQSMPKQVSIQTGLNTLLQLASQQTGQPASPLPPDTNPAAPSQSSPWQSSSPAIAKLAVTLLEAMIPSYRTFTASVTANVAGNSASGQGLGKNNNTDTSSNLPGTATTAPNRSGNVAPQGADAFGAAMQMQKLMQQSGNFLEAGLLKNGSGKQWLNLQLTLTKTIADLQAQTSTQASAAATVQKPASASTAKSDSGNPNAALWRDKLIALFHDLAGAKDSGRLQQTFKQLMVDMDSRTLPANSELMRLLSPLKSELASALNNLTHGSLSLPVQSDMKSGLLALISALLPQNANETKAWPQAFSQHELLRTPFAFPHPEAAANMASLAKANAIMADQEMTTGQLLKLMAGMLNRLQFNQLNSLYQNQSAGNETAQTQSWFFELPVSGTAAQANVFSLRLDREAAEKKSNKSAEEDQETKWKIALSFDLEGLGSIYIQANLQPPNITTRIWSDSSQTLSLIEQEKPAFRKRLETIGLVVTEIRCHHGKPQANDTRIEKGLVDIRA